MRNVHSQPGLRYGYSDLPLFSWAEGDRATALTFGGRWVNRRKGLPPQIANIVAELAGIGISRKD